MSLNAFFAYPNQSRISDAVTGFVEKINPTGLIKFETWEQMQIGGKILVSEICKKIDESELFCADITTLNPNVLFEIGYAIAKKKRIWLIRDTSIPSANADFNQFALFTTIGYRDYVNSQDIEAAYYNELPHESLEDTIYESVVEPNLNLVENLKAFYLKSQYPDNASLKMASKLDEKLEKSSLDLFIDDPSEGIQPLAWYAENVYNSSLVICHLTAIDRSGSLIQNAKHSLVAGLAHGLDVPILMVIEKSEDLGPADYRELLFKYTHPSDVLKKLDLFLDTILEGQDRVQSMVASQRIATRRVEDLSRLQFGEPVAEHEKLEFLEHGFVKTPAYLAAFDSSQHVFVGRKGTGKTASFKKLSRELGKDRRNFVCEISPLGYEFEAVVGISKQFEKISKRGFLFESIWKFLIYSEIAKKVYEGIWSRPGGGVNKNERELLEIFDDNGSLLKLDFPARLELLCRNVLESVSLSPEGGDDSLALAEVLHSKLLGPIVTAVAGALQGRRRLVVIVDNLDKAWDKNDDIPFLAQFFLGLLNAQHRLTSDFRDQEKNGQGIDAGLCVFVRADIFEWVRSAAPEADKVQHMTLSWQNPDWLRTLVNARIDVCASSFNKKMSTEELWERFFCKQVGEQTLFDHIFSRIVLRPRDLLYFLRAAIMAAVSARHEKVSEDDIEKAGESYSTFVYSSFLVEMRERWPKIEILIDNFLGLDPILSESNLLELLEVPEQEDPDILTDLMLASFLQIKIPNRGFTSVTDRDRILKVLKACRNVGAQQGVELQFRIHPAFWPELIIA